MGEERKHVDDLWDRIDVTEEALPAILYVIRQEPTERHAFLIRSLIADHAWKTGDAVESAVRVVGAALGMSDPFVIGYAAREELGLLGRPNTLSMRVRIFPPEHAPKGGVALTVDLAALK